MHVLALLISAVCRSDWILVAVTSSRIFTFIHVHSPRKLPILCISPESLDAKFSLGPTAFSSIFSIFYVCWSEFPIQSRSSCSSLSTLSYNNCIFSSNWLFFNTFQIPDLFFWNFVPLLFGNFIPTVFFLYFRPLIAFQCDHFSSIFHLILHHRILHFYTIAHHFCSTLCFQNVLQSSNEYL